MYVTGVSIQPNHQFGAEALPKPKIRIPKRSANASNHNGNNTNGHVNLDESLFARSGNSYITTRAIIEDSHSRLERNYSYIEAMKEDLPYAKATITNTNAPCKRTDTNRIHNGSRIEVGKPPMSLPCSSPSTSSSTSSASSTLSQKQRSPTVI